jgi:exo-beta-1,3-glucanase (GH17 family)
MEPVRSVAAVVALVTCVHIVVWTLARKQATAPEYGGQIASLSYAPLSNTASAESDNLATEERIRTDLKAIAPLARTVRTYRATNGAELVPPIAAEFGLKVTVGAWIDFAPRPDEGEMKKRNDREVRSAIALARRNANVNAVVVGSGVLSRATSEKAADQTADDLIEIIKLVKHSSSVPVTTGETWSKWQKYPKLAWSVDFISADVLPYRNGIPSERAVDEAFVRYNELRQLYPGKRVVIGEFGWPSAGYRRGDANPGRIAQAEVVRTFLSRAEALGIEYNIVEAIDQSWETSESGAGPYWGILDTSLVPKFAWAGPITNPNHWKLAGLSVLIGLLLSLPIFALTRVTVARALVFAVAANGLGALISAGFVS